MILSFVNVRECIVSYQDLDGVTHSVKVHAGSVYQAAALAVIEFRNHEFFARNPATAPPLQLKSQHPPSCLVGGIVQQVSNTGQRNACPTRELHALYNG